MEIIFFHNDLYRCYEKECKDNQGIESLSGARIDGKVSGNTVQLLWPHITPKICVSCASVVWEI